MAKRRKKKVRAEEAEAPTVNCLLMCRDVLQSTVKGTYTLVDAFHMLILPQVPMRLSGFAVCLRMSNVYGKQTVRIKWMKDGDDPMFTFDVTTHPLANPLGLVFTHAPLPEFEISVAGRYVLEAEYNGVPLATLPIDIHVAEPEFHP